MLALLLAMGGAWAQQETLLTTVTVTGLSTYSQSPDGIVTVVISGGEYYYDEDPGWYEDEGGSATVTVTAAEGYTITRCVFKQSTYTLEDNQAPFVLTMVAGQGVSVEASDGHRNGPNGMDGVKSIEVYGTAPAQPIRLTPDATGKVWTLAETPDYDLDLKVVYYQKYALKNIPANWQVKVDGDDKTDAIDHDSLKITESAQVLLTPDHPERVKKVMLVDPTITVDGVTLFGAVGMTWNDIAALNDNMTIDGTLVKYQNSVLVTPGPLAVYPTAQYDPSNNYSWWTGN